MIFYVLVLNHFQKLSWFSLGLPLSTTHLPKPIGMCQISEAALGSSLAAALKHAAETDLESDSRSLLQTTSLMNFQIWSGLVGWLGKGCLGLSLPRHVTAVV